MTGFDSTGDKPKSKTTSENGTRGSADMITGRLREFYDSVIEEGTPDFLLSLLDQLETAEKAAHDHRKLDDQK